MSFKSEIKKVGLFLKDLSKKIGVTLKKIFSSKKFKESVSYVNKTILNIDKESEKELIKIVTDNIVVAESTQLKGLKKAEKVVKDSLKIIGEHVALKLKNISIQDIMYLVGILVPQLYGKK